MPHHLPQIAFYGFVGSAHKTIHGFGGRDNQGLFHRAWWHISAFQRLPILYRHR